jgi:hypothetical protein
MEHWICVTCGTQFAQSETPPPTCPICSDPRQYIGYEGQRWTTLATMRRDGFLDILPMRKRRGFPPSQVGVTVSLEVPSTIPSVFGLIPPPQS